MEPEQVDTSVQQSVPVDGGEEVAQPQVVQPETKKSSGLVVGLLVGLVIGAVIGALVMMMVQGEGDGNTKKSGGNGGGSSENENGGGNGNGGGAANTGETEIAKRDQQRKDDLARFLTAITDYQANNSGRLPFQMDGTKLTLADMFVQRYIDKDCGRIGLDVSDASCGKDFSDPDGTPYRFMEARIDSATLRVILPKKLDYSIYVGVGMTCGREADAVVQTGRDRQVAMLMTLESGEMVCSDNQ